MEVGARLKQLRTARGLSQRQLALRAGVTNGLISMIEQGQTSPSVASLKKILDSVQMTFSEFFSTEYPDTEKVFFGRDELREINPLRVFGVGDGANALVSLRQVGNASAHSLQMLHEIYAPGADTGVELYSHEAEEAGIIISGRIELTVGTEARELGPGDAYIFDSRIPHRFRNLRDEACVVVSACTPPTF
ncbi:XRE family transcriptional regulator [Hoeflea marina]|uniref:XRE family transcriptional regulator n=1 Tax=Hoeflea marina TaxID=274592 RepID=A0A317PN79_9HYPH|nr:cupin domain-containing protein [Hoeflea marina]PWW01699.1 XRE family transcriptional regulator [Hoeflea marina]